MINLRTPPDRGVPADGEVEGLGEAAVEAGGTETGAEAEGEATAVVAAGGLEAGALEEGGRVEVGELQATRVRLTITKIAIKRKNRVFTIISLLLFFAHVYHSIRILEKRRSEQDAG